MIPNSGLAWEPSPIPDRRRPQRPSIERRPSQSDNAYATSNASDSSPPKRTRAVRLLYQNARSKGKIFNIFKKQYILLFLNLGLSKNGIHVIEPIKTNQYWKFQLDMSKKKWLTYTTFRSSVPICRYGAWKIAYNLSAYLSMLRTSPVA